MGLNVLSDTNPELSSCIIDPWGWDQYVVQKRRKRIITIRCVTAQKSAVIFLFLKSELFECPRKASFSSFEKNRLIQAEIGTDTGESNKFKV